jgi:hypothetical protein
MTRPRWQQIVMVSAPVLLILFSLLHGGDFILEHGLTLPDEDDVIRYLVGISDRWQALHLFGLFLFPLLGLTLWLMLPPDGAAKTVSRVALAAYVILYVAFDSVAGIGTSVLLDQRRDLDSAGQAVVDSLVAHFLFDPSGVVFQLGRVAGVAWAVGAIAAAITLWRHWSWQVGLPVAFAGVAFAIDHSPPFGTLTGILLGLAVWRLLAHEKATARRRSGHGRPSTV